MFVKYVDRNLEYIYMLHVQDDVLLAYCVKIGTRLFGSIIYRHAHAFTGGHRACQH